MVHRSTSLHRRTPFARDLHDEDMIDRPKSRKPPRRRRSTSKQRRSSYYRQDEHHRHYPDDDLDDLDNELYYYRDPWVATTMAPDDETVGWDAYAYPSYFADDPYAGRLRRHKSTGTTAQHQHRKRQPRQPQESDHQVPQRWADIWISDEPLAEAASTRQQQVPERRRTIHEQPRAPVVSPAADDGHDDVPAPARPLRRRHSLYEQPTGSSNLLMNSSPPVMQQQPMTATSPWVSPAPAMGMIQQQHLARPPAALPPMMAPHHSFMPPLPRPPLMPLSGMGPMMHLHQMPMPFINPFADMLGPGAVPPPPMMHGAPFVSPLHHHPGVAFGPPPLPPPPGPGPGPAAPPPAAPAPSSSAQPPSSDPPAAQSREIEKEEPKNEEPSKEDAAPAAADAADKKDDVPKESSDDNKPAELAAASAAAVVASRAIAGGAGELRRSKSLFGWFDKRKPPPAIQDRSRWDPSAVMSINDAAYRPAPRSAGRGGLYPAGHPLNERITPPVASSSASASSSLLSRKESTRLSNKAQRLRARAFIWCYRPMQHDVVGDKVVWAAFDVANQDRLDPYIPSVVHHQPPHSNASPLVTMGSEPELPGLTMVRPLEGIGFHYKSALSSRPLTLEVRCLPNDNNLMVRQPPSTTAMDAAPALSFASNSSSGIAGKLWNAISK